jgi:hypothetical protein
VDGEVLEFGAGGAVGQPPGRGEVDLAAVVPEELFVLGVRFLGKEGEKGKGCGLVTYILVKAGVVEIDWIRPGVVVPDIIRIDVEATRKYTLLHRKPGRRIS